MRCLFCGKRLPLLRKLTDSEFCSATHRRLYQQEQEKIALARLMDAQKRFERFTGGLPNGKNGHSDKIPDWDRSEQRGFLPHHPSARTLWDMKHLSANPADQAFETCLPDFRFAWPEAGSPSTAKMDTFPEPKRSAPENLPADENPLPIEPETARPKQLALPAPSSPPQAAPADWPWLEPPQSQSRPLWSNLNDVVTHIQAGSPVLPEAVLFDPPAAEWMDQGAALLPHVELTAAAPAEPLLRAYADLGFPRETPALPGHAFYLADSVTFEPPDPEALETPAFPGHPTRLADSVTSQSPDPQALETPVLHGQGFRLAGCAAFELPTAFESPMLPGYAFRLAGSATFQPPNIQALDEPAVVGEIAADDNAPPLGASLCAVPLPEIIDLQLPVRRGRMRHIYFPLPRLGDLPALVTEVAHRHVAFLRIPQSQSKSWRPGRVAVRFSVSLRGPKRRPASAGARLDFAWNSAACLPRLAIPVLSSELSPLSERVKLPLRAVPPQSIEPAGDEHHVVESVADLAPLAPKYELIAAAVALSSTALIPLTVSTQVGDSSARQTSVEPLVPAGTEQIQFPMRVSPSAPIRRTPPESERMAPVEPGVSNHSFLSFASLSAAPLLASPGTAVVPSQEIPVCGPSVRANILPLSLGEAVSSPHAVVTRQELATLTPDPVRCLPRLRASVLEDREMREAVRVMTTMLRQSSGWGSAIRSKIPSIRIPHPDLKWFTMSIPVLLLLSVYFAVNREKPAPGAVADPAAVASSEPQQSDFVNTRLDGIRQSIMRRAAISLADDFRAGLGDWEGRGDWSKHWAYDKAGFLTTGPLALYTPSLSLTDYRMEFLGQIDKKSIGWVFRAANTENYYASKITLVRGGPLPSAVIERYAVVDGKTSVYEKRPLPLQVHTDTLYRVRMDVQGADFTLSVQGQVVDYWSDNRLKSGGIGFFSGRGEGARLRWVEVTHQYDFLGRLCAFLAPYSLPAKDGSLRQ